MKAKILILVSLLYSVATWGQLKPEEAEKLRIQNELEYFSVESVRQAYNDFCKTKGYNATLYADKLKELESLASQKDNTDAMAAAVKLKREILLSNPLLDNAKIIVGRYRIGNNARSVWAPSLGTQNNNWSNQSSSSRSGFDAEIAELSNLRGEIESRTIYKPTNGSSVTDLMLHWDGERILFTAADENHRWGVFEVNRNGENLHKVIKVDEPDLEFFDGAYMPDGRIIAMSNIGYQGVPCVNGDDPVGNMISFDPKSSLRN